MCRRSKTEVLARYEHSITFLEGKRGAELNIVQIAVDSPSLNLLG
jgi:hypothetical protein